MAMQNKRKICFTFALLIFVICLLFASGCSSEGDNLISNGNFSSGSGSKISDWDIYDYNENIGDKDSTKITIVNDGYEGKGVKIESTKDNDARIYQELEVEPESKYRVTLYAKYENVDKGENGKGAGLNISSKAVGSEKTGGLYGTSDGWKQLTTYFTTGEKQNSTELTIGIGGYSAVCGGTVYLDEIEVVKVDTVPKGASVFKSSGGIDTSASTEIKLLFLGLSAITLVFVIAVSIRADNNNFKKKLPTSEKNPVLNRKDIIIISGMVIVAIIMSFWDLGDTKSAYSFWKAEEAGEYVIAEFEEETTVTRMCHLNNIPLNGSSFSVYYEDSETGEFKNAYAQESSNNKKIATIENAKHTGFYVWEFVDLAKFKTQKIKIVADVPGLAINEVGFFKTNNKGEYEQIALKSTKCSYDEKKNSDANPTMIFDEQSVVPKYKDYRNSTYFDEIYFPRTAYESINGYSIYEVTHPPLGKNIMALGIQIFGMNPFGWRFMGTLFGVAMIPMMYLLALKIFKKRTYAFFAAFLIMFDFMRLAQTRLATIDSYSAFFIICMYYFMYDYFSQKSYEKKSLWKSFKPLLLCGIMFGLGAATKWVCLYAGVGLAILFFLAKYLEYRDISSGKVYGLTVKKWFNDNFLLTCLACIGFFVVIPAVIYVLSYIPYMASNPDKGLIDIVLDNQEYMFEYHSGLTSDHPYGSPWYTWPFMQRPIYYYSGSNANITAGNATSIVSFGNPLVWWTGFLCILPTAYFAWKKKEKSMMVVLVAFAVQYFPWILVTRVAFIYHYFTAVPFIILMIVYVAKNLLEDKIIKKQVVWAFMALVLLLFVMFYPVLTAREVSRDYIDEWLRWFSTWSF